MKHLNRIPPSRLRQRSGFSILEVIVVTTVLTVALGMFASTLVSINRIVPVTHESVRALEQVNNLIETMRGQDFYWLSEMYNEDPTDDPLGEGTSPGAHFAVPGLRALTDDTDGSPGRIVFPIIDGELREDYVDRDMGMPRDLNGDGAIDSLDHTADYLILPALIELEWQGQSLRQRKRVYVAFGEF